MVRNHDFKDFLKYLLLPLVKQLQLHTLHIHTISSQLTGIILEQ